jgi:hypothetical protein
VEPDPDEDDLESMEATAEVPHGPSLRRLLLFVGLPLLLLAFLLAYGVWSGFGGGPAGVDATGHVRTARVTSARQRRPVAQLTTVRCPVGHALDGWDAVRVEQLVERGERKELVVVPYRIEGNMLVFTHRDPEGVAALHWGQHRSRGRAMFAWETDGAGVHCAFREALPSPRNAPLLGHVDGAAELPEGEVSLEGCGATPADLVDRDGGFFLPTIGEGCRLRAWRTHGSLRVPGPWVAVTPVSGTEVEVRLSVPTWQPAGMGIQIRPDAEGMRVTRVLSGSPAEAAGVLEGDLLLSIDGVSTVGMDLDTFLQYGLGPEGSEVELEVASGDGEAEILPVRRALLE